MSQACLNQRENREREKEMQSYVICFYKQGKAHRHIPCFFSIKKTLLVSCSGLEELSYDFKEVTTLVDSCFTAEDIELHCFSFEAPSHTLSCLTVVFWRGNRTCFLFFLFSGTSRRRNCSACRRSIIRTVALLAEQQRVTKSGLARGVFHVASSFMCVCTYACMYVCYSLVIAVCICTHICLHAQLYGSTCVCMYACISVDSVILQWYVEHFHQHFLV